MIEIISMPLVAHRCTCIPSCCWAYLELLTVPAVTLDISYVAALLIAIGLHVLSGAIDHSGDIGGF